MKKLLSLAVLVLCFASLCFPALADAAIPPEGYVVRETLTSRPIIPIILAIVIIGIVVLVKIIQTKRRK